MTPPEPTRRWLVRLATCSIMISGAALASPGELWCSAYQTR